MIEILAGKGINKALRTLGIEATRTYKSKQKDLDYEVWDLTNKKDVNLLNELTEWPDEFGWYRYAKGCNLGTPCSFFKVNGYELIAWDGPSRESILDEWMDLGFEDRASYNHSIKKYEEEMMPKEYETLRSYLCNELGCSTASNVCACAVDLARANGMTMGRLFETYEG